MLKHLRIIIALAIMLITLSTQAAQDPRRQLPSFFYHSYIGLNIGYSKINYTNKQLASGYQAFKIENQSAGARIFIGHYFTPYLAAQLSLMRPFLWTYYSEIVGDHAPENRNSVWTSLFGLLTLKPTWRINDRWWLYGEGGLGWISRHGFTRNAFDGNHFPLVESGEVFTPIWGGGLSYRVSGEWFLDASVIYTPSVHSLHQPNSFYAAFGFMHYFLPPCSCPDDSDTGPVYIFPRNVIEVGYFNRHLINWEANKYVSAPYVPIFWDGRIKTENGVSVMYERNFFHTRRLFSLHWGASVSHWVSRELRNQYFAFSIFPAIRFWLIRGKYADFYFTYSVAGPTILTRRVIDNQSTSKHFTFQDFLGFAKLDLEKDDTLTLYESGEVLSRGSLKNPLIVVANYIFDTLKNDVFTVKNAGLFESVVSLKTASGNITDDKPTDWEKVDVEYEALQINGGYYDDVHYNAVLDDFKEGLSDSHFLFPIATLNAMKRLKAMANDKMLVLCSDKGYSTLEEQDELEYPELAFHGSFSVMVNFAAIARYFKKSGGDAMLQTQREGITSAVFASGIQFSDYPETTLALEQFIEGFSPGDYFVLQEEVSEHTDKAKIEVLASLLSMSHWDPYVFDQINERICELLGEEDGSDPDTVEYLAKNMKKISDNFYLVPEVEDAYCNIALFFHEAEKYEEAIPYYIQSLKYFGEEHVVLYNLGICYYELDDNAVALDYFNRALEADPKSQDTKDMIKTLNKKSSS